MNFVDDDGKLSINEEGDADEDADEAENDFGCDITGVFRMDDKGLEVLEGRELTIKGDLSSSLALEDAETER